MIQYTKVRVLIEYYFFPLNITPSTVYIISITVLGGRVFRKNTIVHMYVGLHKCWNLVCKQLFGEFIFVGFLLYRKPPLSNWDTPATQGRNVHEEIEEACTNIMFSYVYRATAQFYKSGYCSSFGLILSRISTTPTLAHSTTNVSRESIYFCGNQCYLSTAFPHISHPAESPYYNNHYG